MRTAMSTASARPWASSKVRTKWLTIVLFLLPAVFVFALFVLLPVVQAAHYSLYKWNGLQPLDNFVGLKNYQTAFDSSIFKTAISNNVLIIVLSLAIQIPFSLFLATLLNRRFRGRGIFRLIFFLPYFLSETITAVVFSLMLQRVSLLDSGIKLPGVGGFFQHWVGYQSYV